MTQSRVAESAAPAPSLPGSAPTRHSFTNNGVGLERADMERQLPPRPPAGSQEQEGSEGGDPALVPRPGAWTCLMNTEG